MTEHDHTVPWTLDTLQIHLSQRINALAELTDAHFESLKSATELALTAADKDMETLRQNMKDGFEKSNEWRQTLGDRDQAYLPRIDYDLRHQIISTELNTLKDKFTVDINALKDTLIRIESRTAGKSSGLSMVGAIVLGVVTVVASLAAIIAFGVDMSK